MFVISVWELAHGTCVRVLSMHTAAVSALGWHPASGCLATGDEDGFVLLWEPAALERAASDAPPVQTLCIEHSEVLAICSSADGTALFCGLDDGRVGLLAPPSLGAA